ncbi:hypothetical protein [Chitinophaga eiseniae]|uniref:Uncharacterized protein n=1 Tax=Chitinophaga eiseniae TaxID=634771 RepID=A0A847SD47_9BACT|nr:hypothetical protein [Chitinophaga eiseniae]NLR77663.1 hypothetical protein [Chitinophaga eiseniae]
MYIPVIIFSFFTLWYIHFRTRSFRQARIKEKRLKPVPGEDAIHTVRIVGISNSVFSVSKYLRSVKNLSDKRFMTVAVDQVITTAMGTTRQARLIENLAPGEERRLGHSDHVREGKYQIYIGYEILWARYIPAPAHYKGKAKEPYVPARLYNDLLHQHQHSLIQAMEARKDLLS